jgi:phosphoadenosine phosphosulfate reductase
MTELLISPDDLQRELTDLAATASAALEGAHPLDVLRWAGATFGDRFCLTSSMGDAVLATLASEAIPGVDVVFLDTGYHFAETLATRDRVANELNVRVVTVKPELTVAQQNIRLGQSLYAREPDQCCAIRKVEPLNRGLAPYDAWASGLRRDETFARRNTPVVGVDARRGKIKVNPLATWTQADVDAYVVEHDVIMNPLGERGFLSIGCAPCTRPVAAGEDRRAGRWAGKEKTECGIHL